MGYIFGTTPSFANFTLNLATYLGQHQACKFTLNLDGPHIWQLAQHQSLQFQVR
jgi:hypothetical protein